MRSFKHIFLVVLVAVLMGACSSANIMPINAQTTDTASSIIVFRPSATMAMLNDMVIAIDGVDVAILQDKQYLTALVAPGNHTISVRGTAGLESELHFNSAPSQTLYFEAAGSPNNSINFLPGSVFLKSNFYIEPADSFDSTDLTMVNINYK